MLPFFYNLLFPLVFVVLLPGYLRRMVRRGQYRRNFGQRFGRYSPETRARLMALPGAVWVQAVSVGEMLVALKLLAALREAEAALPLVVSTTTTTGFALATERVPPGVEVIYTPVDLRGAVRRTFEAVRPSQLVIVDGGLWPNQLWEARRREIPTALVNARLSPRSARRFRRFLPVARALFQNLGLVGVAEPADVARWTELGVPASRVVLTGSIKQDDAESAADPATRKDGTASTHRTSPSEFLRKLGVAVDAPVLLAASTHPGEERLFGEVFREFRKHHPNLLLIVAPRHVERTPEILDQLQALGWRVSLRTAPPDTPSAPPEVLLLNTTGELQRWYEVATLAFIGKSLLATGGQNPGEAVQANVPVVFGPHMENFEDLAARLLAADAAVQVADAAALQACCLRLLRDPGERIRLTDAARQVTAVHRGAAARTARKLLEQRRNSACQKDGVLPCSRSPAPAGSVPTSSSSG